MWSSDVHVRELASKIGGQEIRRAAGDEKRARHATRGKGRPQNVAADLARRGIVRFQIVNRRQIDHDREHSAGAARGIGRRHQREDGIGKSRSITEQQRVASERAHQQQGDTAAEAGFFVAHRQHESAADQPDRAAGETGERPFDRLRGDIEPGLCQFRVAEQCPAGDCRRQCDGDEAGGGRRHGLDDERGYDAGEQGEVPPRVLAEAGRRRDDREHNGNQNRNDPTSNARRTVDFCSPGRRFALHCSSPSCSRPGVRHCRLWSVRK